ncbi:Transmembrane protein 223 [Fukomys damarensis]|uniref:Transmembrane protein 223 n=1 Tax=Fukomys damarensis TaxID=885580 RepID=A0A091E0N2_FUKDA|nr:Transmembrane protein 223 [Fukomys damarensis]
MGDSCSCRGPCTAGTPARDVLLFEQKRSPFYVILGCSAPATASSGPRWLQQFCPHLQPQRGPRTPRPRGWVDLRSARWRYELAPGCRALGTVVLGAGLVFSLLSVRSVRL